MGFKQQKQYRLPGYDYAQAGEYFITMCTKDREHLFGEVHQGTVVLSEAGITAQTILLKIPEQFKNALLDAWVIMPNHVHMILVIHETCRIMIGRNMINHVPTKSGIPNNPMELPADTIGKMMRWYKGRVSYECKKSGIKFTWQARFHDHIIRNKRSLENIRRYVQDNPLRWEEDMFNADSDAYRMKFGKIIIDRQK